MGTVSSWIRHFGLRHRESYRLFKEILGIAPRNLDIYLLAARHKSASLRQENGTVLNNERLEFLGDAVLGSLIADLLFHHFETEGEGFLTRTRSKIVQRETLNRIALELGIDRLMFMSSGVNSPRMTIYGNTLEAIIGAVYLDRGYDVCKRFIEKKIIEQFVDVEKVAHEERNYKSQLLEWCQQYKVGLDYSTDEEPVSLSRGEPLFTAVVNLNGHPVSMAKGVSKKSAQQLAAKQALERIREEGMSFIKPPEPAENQSSSDEDSQSSPEIPANIDA